MILYIMNDFDIPIEWIDDVEDESVAGNALKFLKPRIENERVYFRAEKWCLEEYVMNDILLFLKEVSSCLEWYFFGESLEPYFQVRVMAVSEEEDEMCEKDKCQNCGSCKPKEVELTYEQKLEAGWHTCPYSEEINGDYETLCDCSPEREYECIMDI